MFDYCSERCPQRSEERRGRRLLQNKLIVIYFRGRPELEVNMKRLITKLLIMTMIVTISFAETNIPKIDTLAAIAIEPNSGRILYEKNAFSKRPMASTTKIMTIILAMENGNLEDVVTVSKRAAQIGGSTVDLKVGDKIKLSELLYGLMLNSGNDAGIAVAEHIGGSVENFASMMNNKAIEIGAYNTSFTSPHGLDNPEHYSTAYDMAIITRYALKNPQIAKIVKTIEYNMKFMNGNSKQLRNTNPLLTVYEGTTGVKTGYTGMAGKCLVSSAKRNGMEIIAVTLGSQSSQIRIKDSISILNYCFNNYRLVDLRGFYNEKFEVNVLKGQKKMVRTKCKEEYIVPMKKSEEKEVKLIKKLSDNIYATVEENQDLGSVEFKINDEKLGEIEILADERIKRVDFVGYYIKLLKKFFCIEKYFYL